MSWVALALAGAAAVVAARWYAGRVDELGRRRDFPLVSVALLVVLAVGAATPGVLRARQERRLAGVASALAGRPVAVRCQALGGAFVDAGVELGYVRWRADATPEGWTLLKRDACRDLAAYVRAGGRHPSRSQVIAVHVLTHEAMHLAGHTDESAAECAAVQRDARTARLLGAPAGEALALAVSYWRTVYPRMPGGYGPPPAGRAAPWTSTSPTPPGRRPPREPPGRGGSIAGPPLLCYKSEP